MESTLLSATAAATSGELAAPEPLLREPGRRMSGATAGAVVLAGLLTANAANAVFHLISARALGPSRYGDVATLLTVVGLLAFPLGGLQLAIAQRVAGAAARSDISGIRVLYRRAMAWGAAAGVLVFAVMVAVEGKIQSSLSVASRTAVLLTAATVLPTILTPVVSGLAQGLERFVLFSGSQAAATLLRLGLLVPLVAAGAGAAGAMGATFGATLLAVAGTAWWLRPWARRAQPGGKHAHVSTRWTIAMSVAGILAFTSLTSVDVIVAKVSFEPRQAGVYGAASLVGRLILFLPTAVGSVLVPKVSSRAATGRESSSLAIPSLAITAALCLAATGIYALIPEPLLRTTFGSKYSGASSWLWMFGAEMSIFAVANVAFAYDLGRGRWRGAWLLITAAAIEIIGYAAFHSSPRQLLGVNIATGLLLLAGYGAVALVNRAAGSNGGVAAKAASSTIDGLRRGLLRDRG